MSRDISTTEKVRLAWITELRRQGHRQCVGPFEDGTNNVCAIYLLHEMSPSGLRPWSPRQSALDVGLSADQVDAIIYANDSQRKTFSEIADVVEGWFK